MAWPGGETGEGSNYGARFLGWLYGTVVGDDTDWAESRPGGFTWWPHEQAQQISVTPYHADGSYGAGLYTSTEVRRGVPHTDEVLRNVARLNAGLSQSALLLRDNGRLDLACRIFVNTDSDWWARRWVAGVAAEQFITARDLAARLDGFGEAAVSVHPGSGPRPQPDQLFTLREDVLIEAAGKVRWGLQPMTALMAMVGQYALPYQMSPCGEGELDFTWRPSHSRFEAPADPAVRVRAKVADLGSGPGWLIQTVLRVPCGYNRAELSLLYAALLGHSAARPAEQGGTPPAQHLSLALRELERDGLLRQELGAAWNDGWSFTAGHEDVRLEVGLVRYGRGPMESALRMYDSYATQLCGVIGRDIDPPAPSAESSLIGSWYGRRDGSTSYEVIIPPTNLVWVTEYMAVEALGWVIRHIIERVQAAAS